MIRSNAVVVTTGTFLDGEVFWGLKRFPYGRLGEKVRVKKYCKVVEKLKILS